MRERPLLIEQKNAGGEIVPGPKVRGRWVRSVDLLAPLADDLNALRSAQRTRLVFHKHGKPWSADHVANWRRRVFNPVVAGATPYDLRHACVSTWLNAGVPATQVAEWAGHSVNVLLRVYAKCVYGQEEAAKLRIEAALATEASASAGP